MKTAILLLGIFLLLMPAGSAIGQGIYLDHVDGLNGEGLIEDEAILTFHMRIVGDADNHECISNGYRIVSSDLAWETISGAWNPEYPWHCPDPESCFFDLVTQITATSHGASADSIGFGGCAAWGSGLPANFDGIAYTITAGPITGWEGTLTLDSSFCYPATFWMWDIVLENVAWGGPYEFFTDEPVFDPPLAIIVPNPIILTKSTGGLVTVYFGHFGLWGGKTANDVSLETVTVNGITPTSIQVVQDYQGTFGEPCVKVTLSLKKFINGYKPLTGTIEDEFTVSGRFNDAAQFEMTGDVTIIVMSGDFNSDGVVDRIDLELLASYLYRSDEGTPFDSAYDVDGNGRVDPDDLLALKEIIEND